MSNFEQLHPRDPQGKFVEKNMPSSSGVELKEEAMDLEFDNYAKDYLAKRLQKLEGKECWADDLCFYIMDDAQTCGTITFSTSDAYQIICKCPDVADEYLKKQLECYGGIRCSPFRNPERYHIGMMETGIDNLLRNSKFLTENTGRKIVLTKGNIQKIIKEVAPYSAYPFYWDYPAETCF